MNPVFLIMRYYFFLLFFFIIHTKSFSQQFEWVTDISCTLKNIRIYDITDAQNNDVFVAGILYDGTDFMPGSGTLTVNIPGVNPAMFLAKYNSSGTVIWIKALCIEEPSVNVYAIESDLNGDVYLIGKFDDTVDFDPGLDTFNLFAGDETATFILKLDNDGNFIWAKQLSAINDEGQSYGYEIRPDNLGNFYAIGIYSDTIDFDPGPSQFLMPGNIYTRCYIAKYTENGNFIWAKSFDAFHVANLEFDKNGNCVFAGSFYDTIDIDPGPGVFELKANSDGRFITKFDTAGNFIWANNISGYVVLSKIAIDTADYIFACGNIDGDCDFNPLYGGLPMVNFNGTEAYFAKYAPNGQLLDIYVIYGGGDQRLGDIKVDAGNNIVLTGFFENYADFDPGFTTTAIGSNGERDVFIASYRHDGSPVWIKTLGGIESDNPSKIYLSQNGEAYVAGTFKDAVDFDPLSSAGALTQSPLVNSAFLIKYSNTVSDDEIIKNSALLYPNPSSEFVQLKLGNNAEQKFTIEIYNLAGKLVKTVTGFGQELSIPVNDFSNGAYYIKINSDAGTEVMQFIVVK